MSDPFTDFMSGDLTKRRAEQDRTLFLILLVAAGVIVLIGVGMLLF